MTDDIEYVIYSGRDRLATLESRAAELGRRLREATPPGGMPLPEPGGALPGGMSLAEPGGALRGGMPLQEPGGPLPEYPPPWTDDAGQPAPPMAEARDGRTQALINRGRHSAGNTRGRWLRAHWRSFAVLAGAVFFLILVVSWALPGPGASWPASVAQVQAEITVACQNPDVAAEPSQVNFACAKDTQRVLWVFSLLTSGNNPGFSDQATGRKGLEPIQPAQGGAIAWSLNLHHPYDPANPTDSLQVAARAINNIIGGATLTSSNGRLLVQPGLESSAANCQRYTGSAQLVTRAGFPARCAHPVASPAGTAALVSDVFKQWMNGTPAQVAAQAAVLFSNAGNPGDPRVQAILAAVPAGGL